VTTYEVRLRFRADGPAVRGWWTNKAVAEAKFAKEIGIYGSKPGVIITLLVQDDDGQEKVLETWASERGRTSTP
jgi:hypothetical protein